MALPMHEAERIKNEIESNPHFAEHDIQVCIFEPEGETAVIFEIARLTGNQIEVLQAINERNWSWFIDIQSERGLRVGIW